MQKGATRDTKQVCETWPKQSETEGAKDDKQDDSSRVDRDPQQGRPYFASEDVYEHGV
jgi:hypothetical protein